MSENTTPTTAHPDTASQFKAALDLSADHVLVGDTAGTAVVYGTKHNSLLEGFVSVETEHGYLLLDDDREITYEVLPENAPIGGVWPPPATVHKTALELASGDVLLGDDRGTSVVYDVRPGSLLPGFVTVETEHGHLLLDDDPEVTVRVITDPASMG